MKAQKTYETIKQIPHKLWESLNVVSPLINGYFIYKHPVIKDTYYVACYKKDYTFHNEESFNTLREAIKHIFALGFEAAYEPFYGEFVLAHKEYYGKLAE